MWRDSGNTNFRDRIDFPVSHSFFRSLCIQHGEQDPGPCYAPIKELPDIWKVDVSERYFEPKRKSVTKQPLKPVYLSPVKDVKDISI